MKPAFLDGDRVLTFNWGFLKVKDVIVFEKDGRFLIKRISSFEMRKINVSGDNKKASSKPEAIRFQQIVGKVIFKY